MSKNNLIDLAKSINKDLKIEGGLQLVGASTALDIERISIGSLTYDIITGGGFGVGRHNYLFGPESSGKTTAALMALGNYFRGNDKRAAFFMDSEFAFDRKYAQALGIDLDRLFIYQPDNIEQGEIMLAKLINSNDIGIFVVDSIATLQPQSVIDSGATDANIGTHAKALGNLYKTINSGVSKNKITGIWINQIRDSIGGYGGGISLPGGHAPKFYASIMIQINRGSKLPDGDGGFINRGLARCTKNKTAAPYKEGQYNMEHGTGIDVSTEVLDWGLACEVLYKKGHSYYYDETFQNDEEKRKDHLHLGKSKADCKSFLDENVDLRDVLYTTILKCYIDG